MEIRKIAVYALFVFSVAYGFYFHFLGGNKAEPPISVSSSQKARLPSLALVPPAAISRAAMPADGRSNDGWAKNPFEINHTSNPPTQTPSVSSYDFRPRLSAISYAGGKAMAIINGKIVQIGGRFEAWRLDKVTGDSALLTGPNGSIWIKLGG